MKKTKFISKANIKKLAKHSYQTVGGYIEQLVEKEIKKLEGKNGNNMSRVQG